MEIKANIFHYSVL